MANSNRERNPIQCRIDNEKEQDQDDDQYRRRNNSSGFLHDYPSHHVQSAICNNGGAVPAESFNDHQFFSTGANHNQLQEGSPIQLNLRIWDQSLIRHIELALTQNKKQKYNHQEQEVVLPQPKLKASNLFALFLRIGSWNWESKNLGDLVVKFYYGKRKLVWEFLFGPMKRKMEIPWTQVSAINATMDEGRLEIELGDQPEFFKECKFRPLKHTQWEKTDDFTQGQAQRCRRHTILFSPGVLEEPFKKLLQCDNRLYNLNRQPFPIHNSHLFDIPSFQFSYYNNGVSGSSLVPHSNHVQNLVQPTTSFVAHSGSNVPMPGLLMVPNSYEIAREQSGNNQIQDTHLPPITEQVDTDPFEGREPIISDEHLELHHDNQNLARVTTKESCLKVDSTRKDLEQNHQNNFNHFVARTDGSSSTNGGVNVTNHQMACIDEDEDVCCLTQLLFDDDEFAFQEPCHLSSSQYSMPGYDHAGNGGSST